MNMEITKREVIASVSIIAILLILGILIAGVISDAKMDIQEKYNKAVKLESAELFKYGMETSVGNALVYGELISIDPVTYPEIGGEYLSVTKVKERYTQHTRTVTTTDSKGHTTTKTETYWTWDEVGRDSLISKKVVFCGSEFNYSQFDKQSEDYIKTIKESSHVRYKYYGCSKQLTGTAFAFLVNSNISESGAKFYKNMTVDKTIEHVNSNVWIIVFWIFWILIIGGTVCGFYYLDNRWLEK